MVIIFRYARSNGDWVTDILINGGLNRQTHTINRFRQRPKISRDYPEYIRSNNNRNYTHRKYAFQIFGDDTNRSMKLESMNRYGF